MKFHILTLTWVISSLFAAAQKPSSEKMDETKSKSPIPDKKSEQGEESEDKSDKGVVVRTEIPKQIQLSTPVKNLKILSPWAPKPLQSPPVGWRYVAARSNQNYDAKVRLKSGKHLTLKITPYTLVPEDSTEVVQVTEPGYIPSDGYAQKHSVSAVLESSNQLLMSASSSLDQSIVELKELLQTLPQPEKPQQPQNSQQQ